MTKNATYTYHHGSVFFVVVVFAHIEHIVCMILKCLVCVGSDLVVYLGSLSYGEISPSASIEPW